MVSNGGRPVPRPADLERDFDRQPYSRDEQRVADWLHARAPEIGSGDDPIGFVLASYDHLRIQRNAARDALEAIAGESTEPSVQSLVEKGLDSTGDPGPYPTPDEMQDYWRRTIGGSYTPVAMGVHMASHPVTVKRILTKLLNREVCPEAADVIVALIHLDVRSSNLIDDLVKRLAEVER